MARLQWLSAMSVLTESTVARKTMKIWPLIEFSRQASLRPRCGRGCALMISMCLSPLAGVPAARRRPSKLHSRPAAARRGPPGARRMFHNRTLRRS